MDSRTASLVERARPDEKAIFARVVSTLPLKGLLALLIGLFLGGCVYLDSLAPSDSILVPRVITSPLMLLFSRVGSSLNSRSSTSSSWPT